MLSTKKKYVWVIVVLCMILMHQNAHARVWLDVEVVSTESPADSWKASLDAGSDGAVHIAWEDLSTGYGNYGIFYKRYVPGDGWTVPHQTLSWLPGVPGQPLQPSDGALLPCLGVGSDGKVHVAWEDYTDIEGSGQDGDIFYKLYVPASAGPYWTRVLFVSAGSTSYSEQPSLDVSDGVMHIAWYEDKSILYKSYALGQGFPPPEVLSADGTYASAPSLAVGSDGIVHVAWADRTDPNDWDIVYKRYEPASGWTDIEVVSTESTANSSNPSLGVKPDGTVHIAWEDQTNYEGSGTDWDIFYKSLDPSTGGWTMTKVVSTESTGDSGGPSLVVGSCVHIAWADATDFYGEGTDLDIVYKSYDLSADEWTATEVVSTGSTGPSTRPSIALGLGSGGTIHIAWEDQTNYEGSGTDWDIFYRKMFLRGRWLGTGRGTILVVVLVVVFSLAYLLYRHGHKTP